MFAEEQGQESDELRLEFGTFDATIFVLQRIRKPETQTLAMQDMFPFSIVKSCEITGKRKTVFLA